MKLNGSDFLPLLVFCLCWCFLFAFVAVFTNKRSQLNNPNFAKWFLSEKHPDIYLFTATNLNWIKLLEEDENKNIVINSLKFLTDNKRVKVFGFVIMPNHIHLLWQILEPHKTENVQRDFLKYTAQQIKWNLVNKDSPLLDEIKVNAKDKRYQLWERNPL